MLIFKILNVKPVHKSVWIMKSEIQDLLKISRNHKWLQKWKISCKFIGPVMWLALLIFRAMTPAYQRAAPSTSENPVRRRTNTRRRRKRPWNRKTAFLMVRIPDMNLQLHCLLLWWGIAPKPYSTNHSIKRKSWVIEVKITFIFSMSPPLWSSCLPSFWSGGDLI